MRALFNPKSLLSRWTAGLSKTKQAIVGGLLGSGAGKSQVDAEFMENLEASLIQADLGARFTRRILDELEKKSVGGKLTSDEAISLLKSRLLELWKDEPEPKANLVEGDVNVFLVVGVNGVGKTTSIAKLAWMLKRDGYGVILAAADTFRAAAIEQLERWASKASVDVVRHREGGDPAAVVFDAISAARARGLEVVIADTAGRIHTKRNLMDELTKIRRVVSREVHGAPQEVFLVLDATIGQNAISQAKMFHEACGVTGIILAKLDGTAKGGVVVAIKEELGIPIKFVGLGEGIEDLEPFDSVKFVEALL